jgi:hypothetical protein
MKSMNRKQRLALSATKPVPPYEVDPALTFYCPQENVTAFDEPRIRAFMLHLRTDYQPPASVMAAEKAVLLLLPCTKTKPYLLSKEHLHINRYLLDDLGFVPIGEPDYPPAIADALPEGFPVLALHNGLLERDNLVVHRMVVSEPMGIVPFEYIYHWRGELSLVSRYDDPGLFEHRGTSVCTWRKDNTARPLGNGKYRWGVHERAAYVEAHNRYSQHMAAVLQRLKPYYHTILGYVAPKMTHRSFLTSAAEKITDGLPRARKTGKGSGQLIGVNDLVPGLVCIVPDAAEQAEALAALGKRLSHLSPVGRSAYFSTGGGVATALVLPEVLATLKKHLQVVEGR